MGKQAKITQIQNRLAKENNGKAALPVSSKLPDKAVTRIQALNQAVANAQQALQQYVDGVFTGLGVDTEANAVNLQLDGRYTLTPKGKPDAQNKEQAAGGIPDVEELPTESEAEV